MLPVSGAEQFERFRSDGAAPHEFAQGRVVAVRQTVTPLAVGQKQVPQSLCLRFQS